MRSLEKEEHDELVMIFGLLFFKTGGFVRLADSRIEGWVG